MDTTNAADTNAGNATDNSQPVIPPTVDSNVNTDVDTDAGTKADTTVPVDALDATMITKIKDVVMDKVNDNEMFTAFDITKAIKNQGVSAKHNDIKKVVHGMFFNGDMGGGYDRQVVRIGKAKPFVYFPIVSDPTTYMG